MVSAAVTYRSKQPPEAQKTDKNTANTYNVTGKVFQTLFRFLGIFHGKPPIIFDQIALVTCGVNWSAQTCESVFCGLKRSSFHSLSHS